MRLTAEIRCFWPGHPLPEFRDWFVGAGPSWNPVGEGQPRVDEYLSDEDQDSLGIKRRGGGDVEIKGLIARGPMMVELAGCSCPVERWGKWSSCALDVRSHPLIRVEKTRWMRQFRVAAGAASELESPVEESGRQSGCDAELTRLTGPDREAWWTFGLEAFGALEQVENTLAATVAVLVARHPPPLPRGEPGGYPRWLRSRQW